MIIKDIWVNPIKLGTRRRCVGCKQLVLRKSGKRGPKPKYCTYKCFRRFHKRKEYLKKQDWYKEYSKRYRQIHPEYVKQYRDSWRLKKKEKREYINTYLETLRLR